MLKAANTLVMTSIHDRKCKRKRRWVSSQTVALKAYFATPSSPLKQSVKALLCLFEACSPSIFWLVVLWKSWKQVLHLMDLAARFYGCQCAFLRSLPIFGTAYGFQLALCLLWALLLGAIALLLCSVGAVSADTLMEDPLRLPTLLRCPSCLLWSGRSFCVSAGDSGFRPAV